MVNSVMVTACTYAGTGGEGIEKEDQRDLEKSGGKGLGDVEG